ncbi:LysR family transcriptional regulator [Rhodoferax sp.]|uniref:LysR family transcriptional regulator n=1 Tax=Rhodoferax sp. TaxID=50421 RepID=UPI00374D1CBC
MQLQLDDLALFIRIVELGTLSAAARERDVPVSQVTRALTRLEAGCAVRLLHRTTHGLSLTDEGDTFLAYARRMQDATAELDSALSGKISGPSGWVRVAVSALMAEAVVAPGLGGLYQRHPQLHLDIAADDRVVDMAREGIDVAIRTGSPASDAVVARQIGSHSRTLYAAPAYLQQFGTPQHPDDLAQHRMITSSTSAAMNRPDGRSAGVVLQGHTRADNSAVMTALVQHGAGIALLTDLMAVPLVRQGLLVPLLQSHYASPPTPIYAVMLQERHRLPKIRACVDYWQAWLADLQAA